MDRSDFDVIIIGGSYAGLSAAMALGRALRNVLLIDSGAPCNKQTPHSHNFITQDGEKPGVIADKARKQVMAYPTVKTLNDFAIKGSRSDKGFEIATQSGETFSAKKVIFATGIKDIMPDIPGFAECWGISVIHCPYCHGYEVRNESTGIIANGDMAFHYAQLISNWTKDLTIYTNGKSTIPGEQMDKIARRNIGVVEKNIDSLGHNNGKLQQIAFTDGTKTTITAVYARPEFVQHCDIAADLGCEMTDLNYIKIDAFQKTTIPGVFACGDNASMMRSVANAVAMGAMAGAMANNEMIVEEF